MPRQGSLLENGRLFFPLLAVNRGCLCRVGEIPACSETRHFHALACSPFNSRMHILKCRQPLAQHRYPNETVRILVNFSNCAAHKAVRSQGGFLETHAGIIFALTVTRPSLETRTHPQFTVWGFILCGCLFHHLDILGRQLCESDAGGLTSNHHGLVMWAALAMIWFLKICSKLEVLQL